MVLLKLVIAILLILTSYIFEKIKDKLPYSLPSKEGTNFLLFVTIFRLLPFILIFNICQFDARSDVQMFYDSALSALKGGFVYRDFPTAYSPLFPYFTTIPLFFVNSPKSILFQMVMLECFILWGTLKLFKRTENSILTILYLLLPTTFVFSVLGGQEDVLMWGVLVVVLLVYRFNHSFFWVGVLLGLGLLVTKFLLILLFPGIFIYTKSKIKFLAGLLVVGIPSLLFLYYHIQLDFLSPISQANDPRLPNLWSVLHVLSNGISPFGPKWLNWFGLFTILFGSCFLAFKYRKIDFLTFLPNLFILIFIWLMVIQQSSLTNYSYNFMMPVVFLNYMDFSLNQKIAFFIFNIALIIKPAVWWGQNMIYLHHWTDLLIPINFVEFSLEITVVIGLLYLLFFQIKKLNVFLIDK